MTKTAHPDAVFPILASDGIEVVGTRLDVDDVTERELRHLLSDGERDRADRFHFPAHRCHYVVARARLRQLIAERTGLDAGTIDIAVAQHGKPMLGEHHGPCPLRFNLSHSGLLAVYAIASGREVGVDIEAIREVPDAAALAKRFFSAAETAAIMALPADRRELAFLTCWTRKEAFIKALGEGFHHPLTAFQVTVAPDAPAAFVRIGDLDGADAGWNIIGFHPMPGYIGAVVYRSS